MFASKNVLFLVAAGLVGAVAGLTLGALALVAFLAWTEMDGGRE